MSSTDLITLFGDDALKASRGILTIEDAFRVYDDTNPPVMLTHLRDVWGEYVETNFPRFRNLTSVRELSLISRNVYDMIYNFANAVDMAVNQQQTTMASWYTERIHDRLTLGVWNSTGFVGTTGAYVFSQRGDRLMPSRLFQYDGQRWNSNSYYFSDVIPEIGTIDGDQVTLTAQPTWFGNRTDTPPDHKILKHDRVTFNTPVGAIFAALYGATILLCLFSIVVIVHWREKLKKRSPVFCLTILVGLIVFLSTVFVDLLPTTKATCIVERWTQGVGFALVMGNVAAKAYRIWRIFDNAKLSSIVITNRDLAKFGGTILGIELVLLALWTALDPPTITTHYTKDSYQYLCGSANRTVSLLLTIIVYVANALLLAFNGFLAFKTRNVSSEFGEARQIGYTIYNVVIVSIIVVPQCYFTASGTSAGTLFGVRFALSWVGAFVAWALLIGTLGWMVAWKGGLEGRSSETILSLPEQVRRLAGGVIGRDRERVRNLRDAPTAKYVTGTFTYRNMSSFFSVWKKCVLQLSTIPPASLIIYEDFNAKNMAKKHTLVPLTNSTRIFVPHQQGHEKRAPMPGDTFQVVTSDMKLVFQGADMEDCENWVKIIRSALPGSVRAREAGLVESSSTDDSVQDGRDDADMEAGLAP
ncbi:7 transmembrane sweet-taste receptor of 3 GCPR-domain-containing protein [Gaertneriomyces semiglobifer]|nr:7 transmembrane sweet-taste receptor of 3 GCPR-domain-containing protein [Gaertneriomyces semiglobifer]